jgi:hypothetical protein
VAIPRTSARSAPWPPLLLAGLAPKRRRLIEQARGAVLEIGAWAHDLDAYRDLDAVESATSVESLDLIPAGARYDTVVSALALPSYADLPHAIETIRSHLGAVGHLLYLEPVGVPGMIGMVASLTSPLVGATAGLHLDRDVPSALRSCGLVITDNERFTMPTAVWSLRHWVDGRARVEIEGETGVER